MSALRSAVPARQLAGAFTTTARIGAISNRGASRSWSTRPRGENAASSRSTPQCTRSFVSMAPSARPRGTIALKPLRERTSGGRRTMFIQTQETPNSDAIKFLPNTRILPDQLPHPYLEYLTPRSTLAAPYPSPLAAQLLNVDGITSVFYGADSITVTKAADAQWAHVKPEVFSLITEAVTAGQPLVNVTEADAAEAKEQDSLTYDEADSEVVAMIKELLETRIRPAIQEDGGDIEFRGFEGGMVMLKLRGACRTCDSSTVTLKNGIESMLMHYIEEVKGVSQVLDPEEEVAMAEFAKFEEKLRQQKGPQATAGTVGKGSLDLAE